MAGESVENVLDTMSIYWVVSPLALDAVGSRWPSKIGLAWYDESKGARVGVGHFSSTARLRPLDRSTNGERDSSTPT